MSQKNSQIGRLSPVPITKIAFGVRYEPQYAVMDRVGGVIDAVLRASNTPFGPKVFPLCQSAPSEYLLINPETNDSLKINQRDTILQLSFSTRELNHIEEIAVQFSQFVLKPLKEKCRVRNISRYGVLCYLAECSSSMKNLPVEHYLSKDFSNVQTLSLRFTRRLPSIEAVVKKKVSDYRNVIYTINQDDKEKVNISVDFQEYFEPVLDENDWTKKPFEKFVKNGLEYIEGEFEQWFTKLLETTKAA